MKILMITDSLIYGGRERRFLEVVKGLYYQNYTVEVILLKNIVDFPEIYQFASKVHIFERKIKKDPLVFLKIWKVYHKFSPDIVHSWSSMPSIYALPIVLFSKTKFLNAMIADAIHKPFGKHWLRGKLTYPFSDIVLSNSYAGLKAYGVKKSKGRVIWNGYDFKRSPIIHAEEVRSKYNIKTPLVVGMVAIFHDRKDYATYLQTAIRICNKYDNVTFLCIGDGPTKEHHQKMIPQNLVDNKIKFLGFQHNIEEIVSILDIGVLLTNTKVHNEGIPNSILEYMAQSKPVVATTSGGTPEIIIDNKTGYLVEPYSVDDLYNKLEILLLNSDIRKSFGEEGYNQVKANFSFGQMIESTINIYNELFHGNI